MTFARPNHAKTAPPAPTWWTVLTVSVVPDSLVYNAKQKSTSASPTLATRSVPKNASTWTTNSTANVVTATRVPLVKKMWMIAVANLA